jgi:hypothetical protein
MVIEVPPPPARPSSRQLPLPWEPPAARPPELPRAPEVLPQELWARLAPMTRRSVRQTFVRVLQEVLHDDDER